MTGINDLAQAVVTLNHPDGDMTYRALIYLSPPFSKGTICTIQMDKSLGEQFCTEGFLFALVKKENLKVTGIQDLYSKGYLMKYVDRVLSVGKTKSNLVKSRSVNARYVLAECTEEVEVKQFDLKGYLATCTKLLIKPVGETEEKEFRSMLIDQMDKLLNKIGTDRSKIDEYYGAGSLEELTNCIHRFLISYGMLTRPKAIEFLETDNLKKRVDVLLEALASFYFNYVPEDKKNSNINRPQSAETYEDMEKYKKLIDSIKSLDDDVKDELRRRLKYMSTLRPDSSERSSLSEYFETLSHLPWDTYSAPISDLKKMREDMDNSQFGMKEAKERLLEFIASSLNSGEDARGKVICLMGSPGTGKTLFAQNTANILNRKFTSIALGGIDDVTILRGQRKGWIGAEPGQIVKALIRAKSMNPVIIFDEIDKTGARRGDQIRAALLEILDPNQNREFRDAYLDIPIDISRVLFVASGNYFSGIPLPLKDRMEIIQIPAYTTQEKFEIAKRFTIPQLFKEKNIKESDLEISDEAIMQVVENFKFDAGIRRIKMTFNKIINKYLLIKYEMSAGVQRTEKFIITNEKLSEYVKLDNAEVDMFDPNSSVVGEVNMLWTVHDDTGSISGGGRSPVQIRFVDGRGDKVMTGSMTDVTKESVVVALNYLTTKSHELGIESNYFAKHNLFIHMPSIASKKDGPSAGMAITLGMISAIKNLPIAQSFGITGEMDLSGNALPIGGVKTKIISGLQVGLKTFVIPLANKNEYENEVDDEIKKQIEIYFIGHISEAAKIFFPDFVCNLK